MRELDVALQAAKSAGEIMKSYLGKEKGAREKTSFSDIVTDADLECDRQIRSLISRNFPHHKFLTEEFGGAEIKSDNLWIIDPIDGTNNFNREFHFFSVSIGFYKKGVPEVGVIYSPMLEEMFYAEKGNGAYLNNSSIEVSESKELRDSLIISGLSHEREKFYLTLDRISKIGKKAKSFRMLGSAALDLCYVARGIADGCYNPELKCWDYAAGALILQEAGGKIGGTCGEEYSLELSDVVASNGKIHKELLSCF